MIFTSAIIGCRQHNGFVKLSIGIYDGLIKFIESWLAACIGYVTLHMATERFFLK